ncbi:unnamed protein product [Cladocopium goreaui]|uniref:Secreted protein n=1 Tax=Cladocopium goreaui TaxID=2562237 RepID=A0A9P1FHK1_9DINO|nr:unnamed protein product [Cladocopium goreaui]
MRPGRWLGPQLLTLSSLSAGLQSMHWWCQQSSSWAPSAPCSSFSVECPVLNERRVLEYLLNLTSLYTNLLH